MYPPSEQPLIQASMDGPSETGTGYMDTENKTEFFFHSFDHTAWKKYESAGSEMSAFRIMNTTTTARPGIYELNRQKSLVFYPVFIVLGLIMVLGVLSNVLVCYIYRCRSRRATSNFFVIFFAIFDLFGCLVGIPLEVSSLALPFMYDFVPLCKIMSFVESWSVCGQCLTLICVAYDCYGKICCPDGPDFNVKKAKFCCTAAVIIAVVVSIPSAVVFGATKVKTTYWGIFGVSCSIDLTMPPWLRIMYNVCVLGTFVVSLCLMTVLYSLIGFTWCKQRQAEERGEKPSPAKKEFPKKHRFVRQNTVSSSVISYPEEISHHGSISHSFTSISDHARLKSISGGGKTNSLQVSSAPLSASLIQLHVKNKRQASIFTVISVIFVVNMLPFVVVMVLCAATPVFNQFSSNTTEVVFNICIRSYLLNYLVKPVVYIIFNVNFRKEVKHIFNTAWPFLSYSNSSSRKKSPVHKLQRSSTMGPHGPTSRSQIFRPARSST